MIYLKSPTTIQEQLAQLKHRGLSITDEADAASYLMNIGYYRLSGLVAYAKR